MVYHKQLKNALIKFILESHLKRKLKCQWLGRRPGPNTERDAYLGGWLSKVPQHWCCCWSWKSTPLSFTGFDESEVGELLGIIRTHTYHTYRRTQSVGETRNTSSISCTGGTSMRYRSALVIYFSPSDVPYLPQTSGTSKISMFFNISCLCWLGINCKLGGFDRLLILSPLISYLIRYFPSFVTLLRNGNYSIHQVKLLIVH